ncbi:MAG: T9SS type A sorting domain-containing protein [Candidatus Krumholzibacteria bacterium]|nr:T9SS type A sorting domain-containing protein [Candidatus Krumholzibacteria bacterium]
MKTTRYALVPATAIVLLVLSLAWQVGEREGIISGNGMKPIAKDQQQHEDYTDLGKEPSREAISTPLKVKLSMPEFPALREQAEIRCIMDASWDMPNVSAEIILPEGATLTGGSLSWRGDLRQGSPDSFSAQIVFKSPGNWYIKACARTRADSITSYSAVDYLLLSINDSGSREGYVLEGDSMRIEAVPLKLPDALPGTGSNEGIRGMTVDEITEEPPDLDPDRENVAPHQLQSAAGSLTITGKFSYYDRGSENDLFAQPVPARYFLVRLLNGSGSHLAWAYTNSRGEFTFPPVTNPGSTGVKVRIYTYVSYAPNSYKLLVVHRGGDSLDDTYYGTTGAYAFADGTNSIGSWAIPKSILFFYVKAWWIKDDLDRGFRYPPDQPGGSIAEWPDDKDPWNNGNVLAWYTNGGHVHIKTGSADDAPDVVLHEMAHNMIWNIYKSLPPSDCPDDGLYSTYKVSGSNCAWNEGWANFYPLAVIGDQTFDFPGGGSVDLEKPTWRNGWDNGDKVIYRVTGALLDLMDSNSDGYDQYCYGFSPIWRVVQSFHPETFGWFWVFWIAQGYDRCGGVQCFYQNTIDRNTKPIIAWGTQPNLQLCESGRLDNALDLWQYTVDLQCDDDKLRYYVHENSDTNCAVAIDRNRYVDIQPKANWSGRTDVTFLVSDGLDFAVSAPVRITVQEAAISLTAPNGGEKLLAGNTCDIVWKSSCVLGNVRIEHSVDGGNNWSTITSSTENDGSYTWTVPAVHSATCRVRISDLDGYPSVISNSDFTIQGELAVWPGDLDNNGVVEAADVLPLAEHWYAAGPQRIGIDYAWSSHTVRIWPDPEAAFADADGSGRIDIGDFIPVCLNWGKTHSGGVSSRPGTEEFGRGEKREVLEMLYDQVRDSREGPKYEIRMFIQKVLGVPDPKAFLVHQNYPNPFNPSTEIAYDVASKGCITIRIYNARGQQVKLLVNAEHAPGSYRVMWDGLDDQEKRVASGIYFYRLVAPSYTATKKMVLIR